MEKKILLKWITRNVYYDGNNHWMLFGNQVYRYCSQTKMILHNVFTSNFQVDKMLGTGEFQKNLPARSKNLKSSRKPISMSNTDRISPKDIEKPEMYLDRDPDTLARKALEGGS